MKNILTTLVLIAGLSTAGTTHATAIVYALDYLSGSDWRYTFTLTNDTLAVDVEEFAIYFDGALYSNLAVDASPADWDSLVVQPDNGIPADGFFDSLALVQGIQPGDTLRGFSVTLTYLGTATPGSQPFEVLDSSFDVIDSGNTVLATNTEPNPEPVPEPSTYLMFLSGLAALFTMAGTRSQKSL